MESRKLKINVTIHT